MIIKDFAHRIKGHEDVDMNSCISADMQVSELSRSLLDSYSDMVFVVNNNGNVVGKVEKETLEYLFSNESAHLYCRILDKIPDGIIAVDYAGRIYYANEAYTKLLGVPLRRIIGRFIQDVEPGSLLCKALLSRQAQSSDKQLIASVNKYVSLQAIPLWDVDEFQGVVSVFQDATQLHDLGTEVRKISIIANEYNKQLKNLSTVQSMGILTRDPVYQRMLDRASVIAATDVPVLIRGENGVGKEVLANYIHQCSSRSDGPLITVNCAAIPSELFESELFGYEEGSFTGAKRGGKQGKFELADKGTLFLDEIGDMPVTMQSKLLRVIQYGEIEKLGRQKNIFVDTRIIAATNQPLEELIERKGFRKDLFFRLNNFTIQIPPLRERPDDIALLSDYFVRYYNEKYKKEFRLSTAVINRLKDRCWNGNVRELQGCIERAVILDDVSELLEGVQTDVIPAHVDDISRFVSGDDNLKDKLFLFEDAVIKEVLRTSESHSEAIKRLGLSRRTFYRKLRDHNI